MKVRMARFDQLPPATRDLINEHGLTIIQACLDCGVRNPRRIAHLINTFASAGIYGNGRAGGQKMDGQG